MCHFRVDPKQCITLCDVILQGKVYRNLNKNSSGDEIANVNFLRRYGTYVLQNKKEATSFNQLDDS